MEGVEHYTNESNFRNNGALFDCTIIPLVSIPVFGYQAQRQLDLEQPIPAKTIVIGRSQKLLSCVKGSGIGDVTD